MQYTRVNIQEGIRIKLQSLDLSEEYKEMLCEKICLYPAEIEQNILEWVNNQPLTPVDCHGVSIAQVIQQWNLPENAIPDIVLGFIYYQNSHWRIPQKVWLAASGWRPAHD